MATFKFAATFTHVNANVRNGPILMKKSPSNTCDAILQHVISNWFHAEKRFQISQSSEISFQIFRPNF